MEVIKKSNAIFLVLAGILSLILSYSSYGVMVFYPFNLFVTYLHEASHGLAAILTGGSLHRFFISPDTSGVAYTSGGLRFVIISAGYLGSSLWGSLLLAASLKKGLEKPIITALGVFFFLFTILFARNIMAIGSGLFFSLVMWSCLKVKNQAFLSFFLAFLAVQCCLQAFKDIITLTLLSSSSIHTDAHSMSAELTANLVPPIFFAFLWGVISLGFFFMSLKLTLLSNHKNLT